MSFREWWGGLPGWLKLTFAFVAMPAWLVLMLCVLTGRGKSFAALSAFGVFAFAAILNVVFDRRKGLAGRENGGFDLGGGD